MGSLYNIINVRLGERFYAECSYYRVFVNGDIVWNGEFPTDLQTLVCHIAILECGNVRFTFIIGQSSSDE